eukprot:TRINITY_DN3425_c0_g1_i1.p1 TRINITY_DN3425_c0_g1~~TRINITY_DN3425_c0_g1_i1.p1  ORF type:complete len:188 (+),score=58.86 TRINITY_DN3425_c0_g1_i1:139-702(+)
MGCCFGKDQPSKEEPLLDKNEKEGEGGGQSRELSGNSKSEPASPPPPLSEVKSTPSKKKTGKSPEKEKTPAKKDKSKDKKESPKQSPKETKSKEKEVSPSKKPAKEKSPEQEEKKTAVIDKNLKVQGRGGELPKPKEGTSNLNLNGKPSSQVATNGRSASTVTRLKRSNNCIEDCRMEVDLTSGKLS